MATSFQHSSFIVGLEDKKDKELENDMLYRAFEIVHYQPMCISECFTNKSADGATVMAYIRSSPQQ